MLSSVTFYSFCINKTLKRCQYSALLIACFKFFCINKTLKRRWWINIRLFGFESFRINKTLKLTFNSMLPLSRF